MDNLVNWLRLLHGEDDIVEIRSISPKPVISGYFRVGSDRLQGELARYPRRTFYQTMNPVKSECYSRMQHERLMEHPNETTTDADIKGYEWILIDADPVRASGVSSSDAEKDAARRVAGRVMLKLMAMGFEEPIVADSGNGYHLLFRIQAALSEKQTISDFLSVLDMWFSTDQVKIDTAVFNPARITKLYGTMATKGANTKERPHRPSAVIRFPGGGVKKTRWELVQNVAAEFRQRVSREENPGNAGHKSGTAFDLERFLSEHSVQVMKKVSISTGIKYQLRECPFDPSHRNGDAAVFAYNNGSFGFHCFHNGCAGNHWHEFREKLDPNAYQNSPYTVHQAVNMPTPQRPLPNGKPSQSSEDSTRKPRMLDFASIPNVDRSKIVVIRSRFASLDSKIGGFNKGEMSIWSGGNASGKSTLVGQLGLAAISEGYKVAMFSGEMTAGRVREWILLQAAGPENVMPDPVNVNHFCLKYGVEERLDKALGGRLAIYDNDFGTDWETVIRTIYDWVKEKGASVVIIDNLMALDVPVTTTDKYDMQSRIVKRFSAMAKELNVHVHFICHPRKTDGFLRKGDISGTADITNAADNVFMVHRANADFLTLYKSVYPKLVIPPDVGNVVEIMKNRDLGVVDEMILLYYDKRCKTMSDIRGLPPQHAWDEHYEQITIPEGFIQVSNEDLPEEWR